MTEPPTYVPDTLHEVHETTTRTRPFLLAPNPALAMLVRLGIPTLCSSFFLAPNHYLIYCMNILCSFILFIFSTS